MNLSLVEQTGNDLQSPSIAIEDALILQVSEILDRRLFSQEPALSCPAAVSSYLKLKLAPEEHEVFAAVFLNAQHCPVAFEVLFTGSIDGAAVYPRQLVKRALFHNAAALIISHNHPSGCTDPSSSDIQLTKRIQEALKLVDVRLIDHFIVGSGQPLSFAEQGLI
jgi:DNA repair protein RadC